MRTLLTFTCIFLGKVFNGWAYELQLDFNHQMFMTIVWAFRETKEIYEGSVKHPELG